MSEPCERANKIASSRFWYLASGVKGRRPFVGALVAPFVLLPLFARLAVGPIGDALASAVGNMAPAPARASEPADDDEVPLFVEHRGPASDAPRRVARWSPPAASSAKRPDPDAGAAPKAGTIVVSAAIITKALEDKKV